MSERALKKSAIGRERNAVDSRVYARRLGDESASDAKHGSAALRGTPLRSQRQLSAALLHQGAQSGHRG